jgi:transketolase
MNGIALDKYFIPYGGTFLVFSDYLRPALRLSAIMNLRVIYIMTHDSIGVGEDGPTHQPVEHLATLRAIPNLLVMRPYDRVETLECWQIAIEHEGPSLIALSRQQFASSSKEFTEDNNCVKGIYPICHYGDNNTKPAITIYVTGSEVALAKTLAAHLYEQHGISVVLLSAVCLELFELQPKEYKDKITNNDSLKIVIEAGCKQGWEGLLGNNGLFFGVEYFGRSAPAEQLYEYFGLTVGNMATKILLHLSHK